MAARSGSAAVRAEGLRATDGVARAALEAALLAPLTAVLAPEMAPVLVPVAAPAPAVLALSRALISVLEPAEVAERARTAR